MIWALWELNVILGHTTNVNFFMTVSIENEDTLAIIRRALAQKNTDLTRPGYIFDMTTEEGKAILGM